MFFLFLFEGKRGYIHARNTLMAYFCFNKLNCLAAFDVLFNLNGKKGIIRTIYYYVKLMQQQQQQQKTVSSRPFGPSAVYLYKFFFVFISYS